MFSIVRISRVLIVCAGIAVFAFVCTKATVSSFTHDESYTYHYYPHDSFMDIISMKNSYTNNHILNTVSMKYSEVVFGSSEFALRLPNLILLIVYLIYSYLLFRKAHPVLSVSLFFLLCTITPLLDLFGLARGYAMSTGFMLMSLYHLMQAVKTKENKHVVLFNVGGLLAILSNFTLLDFYAAALLAYNLHGFIESRFILKKQFKFPAYNKVNAVLLLLGFILLYEPVRRVIKFNAFDFGGNEGFFNDTVTQMVYIAFHQIHIPSLMVSILQIVFTATVLVPLAIIIYKTYKGDKGFYQDHKELIIANFIVVGISMAIILQHHLFNTDYLVGRFSIFLFPLFVVNIGFFLQYLSAKSKGVFVLPIAAVIALLVSLNFVFKADLYASSEWKYDMHTKRVMKELISQHEKGEVKLGVNWLFEPTLNFYRKTWKLNWLQPVDRNGITAVDDYDYLFKDELEHLSPADYEVLLEFESTNTILIKRH